MRLLWVSSALHDLEQIHTYISLDSPAEARRVVQHVYEAVQALKATPLIGRPRVHGNTRELVMTRVRYVVTYRIVKDVVEVLYVRHTSRAPLVH